MKKKNISLFGFMAIEIAALSIVSAVLLSGCERRNDTVATAKIIPVKVQEIARVDNLSRQNYVGTVKESFALSLSFSGTGTVERVLASEGQKVSKGQLLAVLSSGTAKNSYDVTLSTLKQAQDAYDRMKPLYEKGSITEIKFIEVETGLEKAKSMEAIARRNLEDTKLYAPFAGVIAKRSVEEGENVMPGVSAFKIVSIDDIDVKVSIPEKEISEIRTGQTATVLVSALNDKQYEGTVDKKGIEANPVTHTYDIDIRVKNPQAQLMPGMVCKVFLAGHTPQSHIIIPNKAVQVSPDGKRFVWLADGDTATRRFITTGPLSEFGVTVINGLNPGDRLITEGGSKVSEGMKVSIIQ